LPKELTKKGGGKGEGKKEAKAEEKENVDDDSNHTKKEWASKTGTPQDGPA